MVSSQSYPSCHLGYLAGRCPQIHLHMADSWPIHVTTHVVSCHVHVISMSHSRAYPCSRSTPLSWHPLTLVRIADYAVMDLHWPSWSFFMPKCRTQPTKTNVDWARQDGWHQHIIPPIPVPVIFAVEGGNKSYVPVLSVVHRRDTVLELGNDSGCKLRVEYVPPII